MKKIRIILLLILVSINVFGDETLDKISNFETEELMFARSSQQISLLLKNYENLREQWLNCKLEVQKIYIPIHCFKFLSHNFKNAPSKFNFSGLTKSDVDFLCQKNLKNYRNPFLLKTFLKVKEVSPVCRSLIEARIKVLNYKIVNDNPSLLL